MPSKLSVFKNTVPKNDKEPAMRTGVNTGVVTGLLSLVAFLYPGLLSDHTSTTILIISAFILPIITAVFARNKVWSIASVSELVDEAVKEAEKAMHQKTMDSVRSQYRLTPKLPHKEY